MDNSPVLTQHCHSAICHLPPKSHTFPPKKSCAIRHATIPSATIWATAPNQASRWRLRRIVSPLLTDLISPRSLHQAFLAPSASGQHGHDGRKSTHQIINPGAPLAPIRQPWARTTLPNPHRVPCAMSEGPAWREIGLGGRLACWLGCLGSWLYRE